MRQGDAPCNHGAPRGAGHAGVGVAFQDLIQRGGPCCDEGDADENGQGFEVEGIQAGTEIAQVQADGRGDQDH